MNRYWSEIAQKTKEIRSARRETRKQFAEAYNKTKPVSLRTNANNIYRYEKAIMLPPADKYLKILSMPKSIK